MPKKTNEQLNHAIRLGSYGELLVQTFLSEYCSFVTPTCYGHPADLFIELGSALYKVQVKTRNVSKQGKYSFPIESHRNQSEIHRHYHCDLLCFVFMPDKRFIFIPNTTKQNYYIFTKKHLEENCEYDSFIKSLETLSNVPVLESL